MAEQTRKITLYFFLLALFIFLAFIIGANMYKIYTQSKSQTETGTKSILQCSLVFYIRNMQYDGSTLSFELETSDTGLLRNLTIVSGDQTREVELGRYILYKQQVNVEDIPIDGTFFVYPKGCEDNKKECDISTGNCRNIKTGTGSTGSMY